MVIEFNMVVKKMDVHRAVCQGMTTDRGFRLGSPPFYLRNGVGRVNNDNNNMRRRT
jgi:hypothetical protein